MKERDKRKSAHRAIRRLRAQVLAQAAYCRSRVVALQPALLAMLAQSTTKTVATVLVVLAGWAVLCSPQGLLAGQPLPPKAQPLLPRRHYPPNIGASYLIDRMISSAGGWQRWLEIRTISQVNEVEIYDSFGKKELQRKKRERYFFEKCRGCPRLVTVFDGDDGREYTFGTNGNHYWALVDDRPRCDPELLEAATRRLREIWFWLRFPFSLRQQGTTADVGGWGLIDGGRVSVWYLDIMPAKTGDGWPLGRLRLLVNQNNYRLEGVVYPKLQRELTNFRGRTSNHCCIGGITLPHRRDVENEEGVVASELVLERLYNVPLADSIFRLPIFEHY